MTSRGGAGASPTSPTKASWSVPTRTPNCNAYPRNKRAYESEPSGGLYLSEGEIAARIGGVKRWKSLAKTFERDGLPKPNPVIGKRYWPRVRQFLDAMEGIGQGGTPYDQPRKENWS
jgi:hypothetical protein